MNPEQWLSLKWNGGSTMSDRWLNQSKIIHLFQDFMCWSLTQYAMFVNLNPVFPNLKFKFCVSSFLFLMKVLIYFK